MIPGVNPSRSIWIAAALAASLARGQEPVESFQATVQSTLGCDMVVLEDGRRVRLQGMSLPAPIVRPSGFAAATRRWLQDRVLGQPFWFEPEPANAGDDDADLTATLRTVPRGPSVQAEAIAAGRAILSCRTAWVVGHDELERAARRAQDERAGWFATTARPPLAEIDEYARAGCRHFVLDLTGPFGDRDEQLRRFAEDVRPLLGKG